MYTAQSDDLRSSPIWPKPVSEQEQYNELAYYTLAHPDAGFIHQNIVDVFAAQTVSEADNPIKIAFALVGLYLCIVKGRIGREAQLAHMRLAKYQIGRVLHRLRIAAASA